MEDARVVTLAAVADRWAHGRSASKSAARFLGQPWRAALAITSVVALIGCSVALVWTVADGAGPGSTVTAYIVISGATPLSMFGFAWACSEQAFTRLSRAVESAQRLQILLFSGASVLFSLFGVSFALAVVTGSPPRNWDAVLASASIVAVAFVAAFLAMRATPPLVVTSELRWGPATACARIALFWALVSASLFVAGSLWFANFEPVAAGVGFALAIASVGYLDRLRVATNNTAREIRVQLTAFFLAADNASGEAPEPAAIAALKVEHFATLDVLSNPRWRTALTPSVLRSDAAVVAVLECSAKHLFGLALPRPSSDLSDEFSQIMGHLPPGDQARLLADYASHLRNRLDGIRRSPAR